MDLINWLIEMLIISFFLSPIIIPIIGVCSEKRGKKKKAAEEAAEEAAREEAARRVQAEQEAKERQEQAKKAAQAALEARKQELKKKMQRQYSTSPVTQAAAKHLVEHLHEEIDEVNRNVHIVEVSCSIEVTYTDHDYPTDCLCIDHEYWNPLVSFSNNILPPPEDREAFICAVCSLAIEMYKAQYPRDKSGTAYSLTFETYPGYCDADVTSVVNYTAPNGFCDVPKSW